MNPDEVAYLAHFGVKGMKWGVHRSKNPLKSKEMKKQINQEAKNLNRALYGTSYNSRKKVVAIRKSIDAKDQKTPGYKKAVRNRAAKKRLALASIANLGIYAIIMPGTTRALAKAVVKVSASSVRNGASYVSAVRKGRKFAEEMGLDTPTIIDETGRIIKNARPNFG